MNQLNDSLEALFAGDTGEVRVIPTRVDCNNELPVYKTAEQRFEDTCSKCHGTGNYRNFGRCFTCKGVGKFTFKTSPEARAAKRDQAADRKVRQVQGWKDAYKAAQPAAWAWMQANCDRFGFANKMLEAISTYGVLTEGQQAAVDRLIAQDATRAAERAERLQKAPVADTAGVDRLKAAFDKAITYSAEKGLKLSPRITVDGMTISPAKATSANPGALYVKSGGTYLGKIADGKFFASRDCGETQKTRVLAFVADPAEAAKVYGQTSGTCCICNATLISKWKHRGIGPICAEKFGW